MSYCISKSKREKKSIIVINHKVIKSVMFCSFNYSTDKETRNSVSSLVATLGVTILTFSPKTQITVMLSSIEAEYVALSECAQEFKFVNLLLE